MKYRTIVADPPWPKPFNHGATYPSGSEAHYRSASVDDIASLPVAEWADEQAHLYLWVLNCNAPDGWKVARAWGFEPQTMLTWCKTQPGIGQRFRNNTEHALFCTRGKPLPRLVVPTATWFRWARTRHSAKPEAFIDLVEQVSPGPYLEMFARRARLGWDYWGDESLGTAEVS